MAMSHNYVSESAVVHPANVAAVSHNCGASFSGMDFIAQTAVIKNIQSTYKVIYVESVRSLMSCFEPL